MKGRSCPMMSADSCDRSLFSSCAPVSCFLFWYPYPITRRVVKGISSATTDFETHSRPILRASHFPACPRLAEDPFHRIWRSLKSPPFWDSDSPAYSSILCYRHTPYLHIIPISQGPDLVISHPSAKPWTSRQSRQNRAPCSNNISVAVWAVWYSAVV